MAFFQQCEHPEKAASKDLHAPLGMATPPQSSNAMQDYALVWDWGRAKQKGHFLQNVPVFIRIFLKIELK